MRKGRRCFFEIGVASALLLMAAGQAPGAVIYVATNGLHDSASRFDTWEGAATNIHDAVAIAASGETVLVSNGVYRLTNEICVATNFSVLSVNGPEFTMLYRDPAAGYFRIFMVSNAEAVVAGFTVTNGLLGAGYGNAINMVAGTVSNCVITQCSRPSTNGGGGVVYVSGGLMTRCIVSSNDAWYGVVYVVGSGVMENGTVFACSACDYGVFSVGDNAAVRRCRFSGNGGNGAYVRITGGVLENSLVYGGSSAGPYMGPAGGVYMTGGRMVNCTVAGNSRTGGNAAGVSYSGGAITNCVVYGNGIGNPGDNFSGNISGCWYSCAPELTNSAQGNTSLSPRFQDAAAFDYRLKIGSPCLDAGTNIVGVTNDFAGALRPLPASYGGALRHDMGAYERDGAAGALEVGCAGTPLKGLNSVTSVFTAAVAGTNTTIDWWGWDFNGDGICETNGASLQTVTNVFGPGLYSVAVRVTNSALETAASTNLDYVLVFTPDIYVSTNGSNVAPYASWADAATNLNAAVDLAQAGCTVHVSNGDYRITKKINLYDKIVIRSVNGPQYTSVWRHTNDVKFGLFDLRHTDAVLAGLAMSNGNVSASSGAAIYMTAGTVSNCVITKCLMEAGYGGSITLSGGRMTGCVVTNMEHWYPAVVLSGSVVVENCEFKNSTCGEQGFLRIGGNAVVRRCRFRGISGNTPYVFVGSGGVLENSLVYKNYAAGQYLGPAAGVYVNGGCMVNCTVATNARTGGTASGVKLDAGVVTNCIIYDNGAGAPADNYAGSASACWYSCAPELTNGAQGNTTLNPRFRDAAAFDYRLKLGSPCLDAGTNIVGVTNDFDGRTRPLAADSGGNLRHDMGAYEKDGTNGPLEVGFSGAPLAGMNSVTGVFNAVVAGSNTEISAWGWDFNGDGTCETGGISLAVVTNVFGPGRYTVAVTVTNGAVESASATNLNYVLVVAPDIYVSTNGSNVLPYLSWGDAATNLNDAVDLALAGCTIHVSNGSHRIARKLDLFKGVALRGVYGPEATTVLRNTNGGLFGLLDVRDADALVTGLTFTNGGAVPRSALYMTAGTISNCVFAKCDSQWEVGGMLALTGGRLVRCVVSNNFAFYVLASVSGTAIVEDSRIMNNSCGQYGLIQLGGSAQIRRTVIGMNSASYDTAGVQISGGRMENCLVYSNMAAVGYDRHAAGGVLMSGGAMVNCTVAGNAKKTGASGAGGVSLSGGVFTNCVIFANTGVVTNDYGGLLSAAWYSCAPELTNSAQGNVTGDPLFAGAAQGNFRLHPNSPCVDRGTNFADSATAIDLEGQPRLRYGKVDMGAYELAYSRGSIFVLR